MSQVTNTEAESALAEAVSVQERLRAARLVVDRLEDQRDAAIRRCAGLGIPRVHIARALGVNRSMIYIAIDANGDDDEDLFVALHEAEQEARARWEASDFKGEPDDYWPWEL